MEGGVLPWDNLGDLKKSQRSGKTGVKRVKVLMKMIISDYTVLL